MPEHLDGRPIVRQKKQLVQQQRLFGYVRLAPGADPDAVLAKLKPILDRVVGLQAHVRR